MSQEELAAMKGEQHLDPQYCEDCGGKKPRT
jgi:hypothetical protein